jgi:hypothetical protein
MRPGFLLDSPRKRAAEPAREEVVVHAVEADDCPVCLEEMESESSILLPCRHLLCVGCAKAVWAVAQSDPERRAMLDCPLCRQAHRVAHGNLPAFVAAHRASNFQQRAGGGGATPRTTRGLDGLSSLSVAELRTVVRSLAVRIDGMNERSDIERAVSDQLESKLPLGETLVDANILSHLPVGTLRAILEVRSIPHADCVLKSDLVARVEQSPKGSCFGLPPRVLKQMLRSYGYAREDEMHVDKHELARQVMVGRAFDRARRAAEEQQRHGHAPWQPQRTDAFSTHPAASTRSQAWSQTQAAVSPAFWVDPNLRQTTQVIDDDQRSPCCACSIQ